MQTIREFIEINEAKIDGDWKLISKVSQQTARVVKLLEKLPLNPSKLFDEFRHILTKDEKDLLSWKEADSPSKAIMMSDTIKLNKKYITIEFNLMYHGRFGRVNRIVERSYRLKDKMLRPDDVFK